MLDKAKWNPFNANQLDPKVLDILSLYSPNIRERAESAPTGMMDYTLK